MPTNEETRTVKKSSMKNRYKGVLPSKCADSNAVFVTHFNVLVFAGYNQNLRSRLFITFVWDTFVHFTKNERARIMFLLIKYPISR